MIAPKIVETVKTTSGLSAVSLTSSLAPLVSPYPAEAARLATAHGITTPIADQPRQFLKAVWSALPAGSLVSLMAETEYVRGGVLHDTVTPDWTWIEDGWNDSWSPAWAQAKNTASYALPGRGGIFWNASSRQKSVLRRYGARGSLDELGYVGAFWADLDCAKRGYTLQAGLDALLAMPLKPSIVVFSGGGLQAIHLLSEAWPVPNRESAAEYKQHSLALYASIYRDHGFELDTSVSEAARMMRLPGFINRKPARAGAVAQIIYWQPDLRYTIQQIKQAAPLPPPKPRNPLSLIPLTPTPDGTYRVHQSFLSYLVDGEQPSERHPMLLNLARQAASAGIPSAEFLTRARPIAALWYGSSGEAHRAGDELESETAWAYEHAAESDSGDYPPGQWLVRLTESGFERASEIDQAAASNKTITLDYSAETAIKEHLGQPLAAIRAEQTQVIREYLADTFKTAAKFGTMLILATSPGAGKTHAAWQAAQDSAKVYQNLSSDESEEPAHGNVAMLTLFKFNEQDWRGYVEGFGVDPKLCFYIVARNGDPQSAGYCALHAQAQTVAGKNWNVVQTLCSRCPFQQKCESGWYLSQFERAKPSPILIGRHQHGFIDELVGRRKLVVIDESPLNVVSAPVSLSLTDLVLERPPMVLADQYPESLALIERWLSVMRSILAGQAPPEKGRFATHAHVQLGGRWLFDQLTRQFGADNLAALAAIEESVIKGAARAGLRDVTPEAVAGLPINYLHVLWSILRDEYRDKYKLGVSQWNSRLIPWGNGLRMHPMEPYQFTRNTRVIVTDATGQPELYATAFTDKQGLARAGHVYDAKLEARAHITQYIGTDNTRTTFKWVPKDVLDAKKKAAKPIPESATVQTDDGADLLLDLSGANDLPDIDTPDNSAVATSKSLIEMLAKKHNKSLLVVTYKETVQRSLQRWATSKSIMAADNIQWFGSLRGKNDYKDLSAVLVIGTHRMQEMDLLALAQVWYWKDPTVISSERMDRVLPYPGYVDPDDKKPRGYAYRGYKDERVNDLYVHSIQAELRQCYERIRPNASDEPRFVYLATAFPCSDHVDELLPWATWEIDAKAAVLVAARIAEGKPIWESELVSALIKSANVSVNTARTSIRRALSEQPNAELGARSRQRPGERVAAWLKEDESRAELSINAITAATGVSRDTVIRIRSDFKNKSRK